MCAFEPGQDRDVAALRCSCMCGGFLQNDDQQRKIHETCFEGSRQSLIKR